MPADRAPTYPFTNAPVFDSRELRRHPKAGTRLVVVGDGAETLELGCLRLHSITSGSDRSAPLPPPQTPKVALVFADASAG